MVPPVNTTAMEVMNAKEPPPGSASPAASGQDHHPSVPVSETRRVGRVDILIKATSADLSLCMAQWSTSNVFDVGMGVSEVCLFFRANVLPWNTLTPTRRVQNLQVFFQDFPPKKGRNSQKGLT